MKRKHIMEEKPINKKVFYRHLKYYGRLDTIYSKQLSDNVIKHGKNFRSLELDFEDFEKTNISVILCSLLELNKLVELRLCNLWKPYFKNEDLINLVDNCKELNRDHP